MMLGIWMGPVFHYLSIWMVWVLKIGADHLYQYDIDVTTQGIYIN